jgi:hypothetical protein
MRSQRMAVPVMAPATRSFVGSAIAQKPTLVQSRPSLVSRGVERSRVVKVAAQAAGATPAKAPEFKWGANMRDLAISVGIAVALWFIPPPAGVSVKAWHLLSVFVGTIGKFRLGFGSCSSCTEACTTDPHASDLD